MTLSPSRVVLIFLLLVSFFVSPAAADTLTPTGTSLPDRVIERRTRFIEERLDASETHGQVWYWSWLVVNSGATIGLGIASGLSDDTDDRINNGVNAGIAALGVADLVFRPLKARLGAAPIRGLPEETRAEKIEKLQAAERLLRDNAERAEERTSWTMQGLNLVINGLAGLAIGLAGDPKDAAITAGANALGGVAYLLSAPSRPADDWRDYQRMIGKADASLDLRASLRMLPGGGRLGLDYRW